MLGNLRYCFGSWGAYWSLNTTQWLIIACNESGKCFTETESTCVIDFAELVGAKASSLYEMVAVNIITALLLLGISDVLF